MKTLTDIKKPQRKIVRSQVKRMARSANPKPWPGIFYVVVLSDSTDTFIKVGITGKSSIQERFDNLEYRHYEINVQVEIRSYWANVCVIEDVVRELNLPKYQFAQLADEDLDLYPLMIAGASECFDLKHLPLILETVYENYDNEQWSVWRDLTSIGDDYYNIAGVCGGYIPMTSDRYQGEFTTTSQMKKWGWTESKIKKLLGHSDRFGYVNGFAYKVREYAVSRVLAAEAT